ncbi:MAG: hypothetical protein PUJ51_11970 [Clostridiales bacterium]|nr:hypothetical protein [Terrisporobacter sp.]MDD7755201.1 hypothetical protein [Clostridiales bacterium]
MILTCIDAYFYFVKSYEMINITPIDLFILGLEVGIGAYLLVKEKENKGG